MCDIVAIPCAGCELKVDVHIGDFSCPSSEVQAWCPHCAKRAVPPEGTVSRIAEPAFWDERDQMWKGAENHSYHKKAKIAVLFCTDPKGTGIHLN